MYITIRICKVTYLQILTTLLNLYHLNPQYLNKGRKQGKILADETDVILTVLFSILGELKHNCYF